MKNALSVVAFVSLLIFTSKLQAQELTKIEHKNDSGYAMVDTKSTAPDADELKMIEEINLVRTNPKGYIPFVEQYIKDKKLTGEPLEYANELIKELGTQTPLAKLTYAPCMFETAKKHAVDQGTTGKIDHDSTDGKDPSKRVGENCPDNFPEWVPIGGGTSVKNGRENLAWDVNYSGYGIDARRTNIQLLVDAYVTSRGHRKTILMDGFTHCAAFVYQDYMADGTRYDRWIQMYGKEHTASSTSNNNTSTSSSPPPTPTTIPEGCPTKKPGSIAWPNLIDGKEVSQDCWNYWWKNWDK